MLAVQAWIAAAFYLFILFTSNPFLRFARPPIEGRDLNPVLQDIGLAIHPPLLYLGYVGFSISFSFAVAALIDGRIDAAWARWVRPWTLLAWMFLTLGIAMGSYWAYYELGWGGLWFWDPVENASLMPWLAGTALLHSAVVMEKRDALKVWTVLLAILTFSLTLLGTFLVRSRRADLGARLRHRPDARRLHPRDPCRCSSAAPGAVRLARAVAVARRPVRADLARRRAGAQQPVPDGGVRDRVRRHALSAGARGLTGTKISVGAPFFNLTFAPLFVPLLLAVPFGPLLAWKRGDLLGAAQRLIAAGVVALIARGLRDGMDAGRRSACAACDRPCGLRHCRRADRYRGAHSAVSRPACDRAAARSRPAALGLGHGASRMPASA